VLGILLRDVLGFAGLPETTEALSSLADCLLAVALRRVEAELAARHGAPRLEDGRPCGFFILGLGKLGGRELNYSSDIDLMFLYEGPGSTAGAERLSNREFFPKVANRLTALLGAHTPEGMVYRVDLRLRPEGRHGEVALPASVALDYYQQRARDWELQMLIKARVVAGDQERGRAFLDAVQHRIYSTSLNFSAIESMAETRERMNEKMSRRRRPAPGIDVKLARGGIRDIEFLVQCLQRLHGGREAWLRNSATLLALGRLRDKDLLSDSEYSRLASAYQFLRHLEHRLQFDEDRQTHLLPDRPEAAALAARRMPRGLLAGEPGAAVLRETLEAHLERVRLIYDRVVTAQPAAAPVPAPEANPPEFAAPHDQPADLPSEPAGSNLMRFLEQRAPGLAAVVARARLGRTQAAFEHFLEKALEREEWIGALDKDPVLAGYLTTTFQHSPWLAEQLMRRPDDFEEIRAMREEGRGTANFAESMAGLSEIQEVRRVYLRQVFRLAVESICLPAPVFDTIARMSELADAAIAACYEIAVEQTARTQPPRDERYRPAKQLMVVALGRLGMFEFDLGSDADLVFILPDADMSEHAFWMRTAERLVAVLGSYTGGGTMFAVDTRLCPNGKGGALVQSESTYREYFSRTAEAWEGLAYMKSRAVAGDTERATHFLEELQKIDWRRYGQSGRSRPRIRQMRLRIEREHGAANPLKNAAGGYYDIDFALLYLRLKSAGMFFRVLNTPRRIEVVEQMGHLEPHDADFLRDAATFYRAVDHGLRLMSGHTEGSLPAGAPALEMLTRLVERWVPAHLCDQPLGDELRQIRERTREIFERLFSGPQP
jgi:glutamate-ammonia-ligase adenylyltransferase